MIGWLLLAPVALVTIVWLVEAGLGLLPPRQRATGAAGGRVTIVIPALDEAGGIAATVASFAGARVLVVADNCSDDTAVVARAAGAEVIERQDATHRGKGYALAFARDHLATDPPDVVSVIDADCRADAAAMAALAALALGSGRPVQGAYLMRPRRDLGAMVALSGFAFLVKNRIRQRGLSRLGAPAVLTGSGMAFPWGVFVGATLATSEPVEDLALGVALARAGHAPAYLDSATIWTEAATRSATHEQRGRWERGFLAMGWTQGLPAIGSLRPGLIWTGLHLFVPPLALLVMLHLALLLGFLLFGVSAALLRVEVLLLAGLVLVLGLAWSLHGRRWLSGRMLLAIPAYMLWKLPIYAAAMLRRERRWNRTRRN